MNTNYTLRRFTSSSESLSTIGSSADAPPEPVLILRLRRAEWLSVAVMDILRPEPDPDEPDRLPRRLGRFFVGVAFFRVFPFSSRIRASSSSRPLSFTRQTSTGTPAEVSTSIQI